MRGTVNNQDITLANFILKILPCQLMSKDILKTIGQRVRFLRKSKNFSGKV